MLRSSKEDDLLTRVRHNGDILIRDLGSSLRGHPHVGDIRGRGLFIGIELVADRATSRPVNAALGLPAAIKKTAMKHGLICYPGGGTADGIDGAHVLLAPPFIYEDHHIEELLDKLGRTLNEVRYV